MKELIGVERERKVGVLGSLVEGKKMYWEKLWGEGVMVMGNEGKGVWKEIENVVCEKVVIGK